MSSQRIFTDQELKEMGRRTLDVVFEAIDSGDKEKAKAMAQRMYQEFNYLHDGYGYWVSGLQTYIYEHYGVEALEQAEREAHTTEAKVVFKPPEKKDIRSLVEHLASGLRGHLQPIKIEEDDEKITLTMQPCGSGERIIQSGGYEVGLARVKNPHRITWGMEDFPIYCVHCPVMEMMDVENNSGTFGAAVHIISEPIYHGACHFAFYKDPSKAPKEFYTRIGKEPPEAKG